MTRLFVFSVLFDGEMYELGIQVFTRTQICESTVCMCLILIPKRTPGTARINVAVQHCLLGVWSDSEHVSEVWFCPSPSKF